MATSLIKELGEKVNRAELIAACLKYFEEYYEKYIAAGNLAPLKEDYEALLLNRNNKVRVLEPNHEYTGLSLGINEDGELLVEKEDGTVTAVYAGEVSVPRRLRIRLKKNRRVLSMEETKNVVLCAASAYEEKYYLNPGFKALPENTRKNYRFYACFTPTRSGAFCSWSLTRAEASSSARKPRKMILPMTRWEAFWRSNPFSGKKENSWKNWKCSTRLYF